MIERYYNGPQSALMDELYDRLTEHGDPSEYPDWPILSLYIAKEIQQIEINHHAEIAEKNEEIELQNIILNPGEHINEQKRGDETILVLTKGKWFIQSI